MIAFRMPSLGADMESGTLVEWHVKPGERVHRGQVVCVVETDKGAIDVEIWDDGTVARLLARPGDVVDTNGVLALLAGEGEDWAAVAAMPSETAGRVATPVSPSEAAGRVATPVSPSEAAGRVATPAPAMAASAVPDASAVPAGLAAVSAAPAAPAVSTIPAVPTAPAASGSPAMPSAGVSALPPESPATPAAPTAVQRPVVAWLPGTGDAAAAGAAPGRARATPAARRRAMELGLTLGRAAPTGPEGAITLADVERAAHAQGASPIAPERGPAPQTEAERQAAMRRAIAASMARSKREIPHYYLGAELDLEPALGWLERYNAERPVTERVLFAALQIKAVALALRDVPDLNGFFVDGAYRPSAAIHPGVAVALRGGGLVAPALHDADRLPLPQLMRALADLLARARRGQLRSSEFADATVTITNLGELGVRTVYGVIAPPQVALVGFGRIEQRPWVRDGALAVARTVHVTLSADHRASDGAVGARFLGRLRDRLDQPQELM